MNRKNIIPILIILMATSLVGTVVAQVYWIKETFWLTQRQIDSEIIGIMEHAIQKTEAEVNNRLIAADLGIDFSRTTGMAGRKDSLYRLKYMIDSMELVITEAEINKKLGVITTPNPPTVAAVAPKTHRSEPSSGLAGRSGHSSGYGAPHSGDASSSGQNVTYAGSNGPNAVGKKVIQGNPYCCQTPNWTTPTNAISGHQHYTFQTNDWRLSNQGSGFTAVQQQAPTTQDLDGAPIGYQYPQTLVDGQVVVLPNGRKMRVNIQPYIKTHVGVKQSTGGYLSQDQQTLIDDYQMGRLNLYDQNALNQLPGIWLGQIDSIYNLNNSLRSKRPLESRYLNGLKQNLAQFSVDGQSEMQALRSINRQLAKVRAGNNVEILRYVDSLTKRQVEIAFSVARTQDSIAQQNNRVLAPELAMQNDVLSVANQSCTMSPNAPSMTAEMGNRHGRSGRSKSPVKISPNTNGNYENRQYGTAGTDPTNAELRQAHKAGSKFNQAAPPEGPRVEVYHTTPTIYQEPQATTAGLSRLSASMNRLIQSAAINDPNANPIDTGILAAHLRQEFKLRNLDLDFEFAIINSNEHEAKPSFASLGFRPDQLANSYKACLFPGELNSSLFLSLYLPNRDSYALYNLKWSMIASILFLLMIIGVFTAGIMTIIRQKRLSVIKSDFISNMTHELKTPLATISLAADTINTQSVLIAPDKIKYFTGIIKEENSRMNGHIERVLQMSLLDKGEFKLKKTEVNLVELVLDQGEYMSLSVNNKGGTLEVDIPEDDLPIFADKLQVQSLLSNLLDNAVKYCERAPKIMITVKREGDYALLSVKDNGIGISEKAQKRIFDRFYRVTQGDLHDVKGFGLGLSFVKAIIEAHEGSVEVISKPNEGSCFLIRLPLILDNN